MKSIYIVYIFNAAEMREPSCSKKWYGSKMREHDVGMGLHVWISHVFIYEWLFTWMFVCCCCNLMMFYDWCECVMSVLGTTKHSSAIVLTLGNKVILYCIVLEGILSLSRGITPCLVGWKAKKVFKSCNKGVNNLQANKVSEMVACYGSKTTVRKALTDQFSQWVVARQSHCWQT